jgi:Caspase domain
MRGDISLRFLALYFAVCLGVAPAGAQGNDKRIALLIGNQAYDASVGVLKNPHNDIAMVAKALSGQNFEVLPPVKDARRSTILGAVRDFAGRLRAAGPGAVGFFYYSGHGAAEKDTNVNYLIPVDAKDPGTATFWDESVKLDDVMRILDQASGAVKFVVFDACRNELQLPTRDTSKGLVPVAEQQGFFVAYASAPGRTASDKGEASGPYAAALAKELGRQGLDHLNLFQNVKEAVITTTGGVQHPWENNGLTRRVYLTGEPTTPADMALWESVRSSNDVAAFQRYLDRFPKGVFAATAVQTIDRLKAEDAQRLAGQQFEVERRAQEAKLTADLQRALSEAKSAREAVGAAEAKRAAAETAAAAAPQNVRAGADAQASRESVTTAEERIKAAEERLALLEKSRGGAPLPAEISTEDAEFLRKTEEARAKKKSIEAEAVKKAREEFRTSKEFKVYNFASFKSDCTTSVLPVVEVAKKPKYGKIVFRNESFVAGVFIRKDLEHCVGKSAAGVAAYYVINDGDRERRDADFYSLRATYPSGTIHLHEFSADLGSRSSTRDKVTVVR